ncbi:MAG TPA: ELWxxDGT repeat protein [Thermoanaerobaculia bacterium]
MRCRTMLSIVILGLLAVLPARGQAPAYLVRDINPSQPLLPLYGPGNEGEGVGGLYYFVTDDGTHGIEVWRTDGTDAGTFLLKDICPGDCASLPRALTGSNGLLFFVADDAQHGPRLWKSDGTPEGTVVVKDDLYPAVADTGGFLPIPLLDVVGKLFFTAASASGTSDLWITDGTAAGTHQVGASAGFFAVKRFLAGGNGKLLFAAEDGAGVEPWVSDGTDAGTHRVADVYPGTGSSVSFFNNSPSGLDAVAAPWGGFLFAATDGVHGTELWSTDGTAAGTTDLGGGATSPFELTAVNSKVVFAAIDAAHGTEVWVTDGTPGGTQLLQDVRAGSPSSDPRELTAVGGQVFFHAADGVHGAELWATDGTPAGTRMVKDLLAGPGDTFPLTSIRYAFTPLNGRLVFYTPVFGTFWTSDGTDAGTQPLSPPAGWPSADIFSLSNNEAVVGSRLFFLGQLNRQVWVTDGTSAGSYPVLTIPLATSSLPVANGAISGLLPFFADLGGKLFFQATDGVTGYELWQSDGTAAGTSQVKDLTGDMLSSYPEELRTVNGRLVFESAGQLGLSDGTAAGTELVPGIPAYDSGVLGNQVFFLSQTSAGDPQLWKTDGTEAGTVQVAPLPHLSGPAEMTASGGKLFFDNFFDLWVSDGTAPGTLDIDPGPGSAPLNLTDVGGTLFFSASLPPDFTRGLWKSDGTKAGTVQVKDIDIVSDGSPFAALPGGILLFPANDFVAGRELWRSDGTTAGTGLLKDINPGHAGGKIRSLTAAGSRVFFVADDGVHGLELWVSDGTAAGTHMVKDIVPGAEPSYPSNLTAAGSLVVFSAFDPAHGMEAWRSDGTALGTRRLADVAPGPLSSTPLGFTLAGSNLFFAANDNTTGFELWAVPQASVQATFTDVPTDYWAWRFVEALARGGVSGGCGDGDFCPGAFINRAQMAIFVLTARGTAPPPATGTRFNDVPAGYWAGPWIEELAREGVVGGCSANPPLYCPDNLLTRAEMAVLLTLARCENPPPATGTRFADVPANYWAARFIEQLAADGVTSGCGGGSYCPDQPITRGEMAVFLATAFHLPLP